MVVYQAVFAVLNFGFTGPPYDKPSPRRFLYYICSFSAPSGICFGIVVVSTTVLVIRLKRNLEWRNEATKTYPGGTGNTKERKAARSVIAICTIFIVCFVPNVTNLVVSNVFPQFDPRDAYWGNLSRIVFILSFVFQVVNSSVNIVVYYSMGTKYREVFKDLFFKKANWALVKTAKESNITNHWLIGAWGGGVVVIVAGGGSRGRAIVKPCHRTRTWKVHYKVKNLIVYTHKGALILFKLYVAFSAALQRN